MHDTRQCSFPPCESEIYICPVRKHQGSSVSKNRQNRRKSTETERNIKKMTAKMKKLPYNQIAETEAEFISVSLSFSIFASALIIQYSSPFHSSINC
jgi:hypothetical protein